ncbi:taurine catabolism dioxygenase [Neurospora crassa]|uniref:2,4-dichlorophenoxyacetate alpha-ketoglutarate dioxygenase n=2 Tax=Neurospora crassa TaxID=5141 RepID=Q1K4X7_NEUCR|nr:2,4-dichlorophenoxyacetate alpha-ketoglutarate dioxygenase [Neurospora crassa OR74A]EAA26963.1 2,4-dichlorophenoxyacetate alpha-ketoglutarate dioxygenase [Neurospora crassa OR74A]KHE87175.1 taurine catabolism dioxygenase [Neurospora crassa]CAC18150.2 related to 2, 4-dichlorophenoxyacetate dioxygenase [Neurospora crassa]|eukprot:XP_956199.1 2,4-dichlorophenoxyacetate alpha-ketoglutarate dioxygenase [Neurospora crassa OR74A]
MSTPSPNSILKDEYPKTITVKELHPTFGAEVLGIQWGDNGVISDEQLQELRDTYGFIILRATPLTDSTHVSFSRLFASGPLDDISRFLPPGRVPRYYPHLELFDASNLSDDGRAILDPSSSPRAMLLRANSSWHSDLAYNPRRSSYSLLRAVELPSREPGEMGEIEGNTEFADSRTAWEELAAEKKRELLTKDWTGVYNAAHSRKLGAPEYFKDVNPEEGPIARHKVVQEHVESGRMNLCVGAYLWRLEDGEGKTVPGSEGIIKFLNEHVANKSFVASVRWERPGDLVIWDNRAVLHRAGEFKGVGKHRRDMRRTTAFDQGPTAWGLNGEGAPLPTLESITKEKGLPLTQSAAVER